MGCTAVAPPLLKGGRADEYYESAKVGYILNCTILFCLLIYYKVKCSIYPPLSPFCKGDIFCLDL